jgi:uncharacterized protein
MKRPFWRKRSPRSRRSSVAITIERAVVGLFFTGVKLTSGRSILPGITAAGSCATPRDAVPGDVCCPVTARAAGYQRLAGRPPS